MGVALAHARSAAWSTAVPTVDASPGPGCGSCGRCDVAMFQVSAKITPTSTGPTVDASPVRPRVPRRPRGLDPRCTASPLGTKPERTTALRRRGLCHQKLEVTNVPRHAPDRGSGAQPPVAPSPGQYPAREPSRPAGIARRRYPRRRRRRPPIRVHHRRGGRGDRGLQLELPGAEVALPARGQAARTGPRLRADRTEGAAVTPDRSALSFFSSRLISSQLRLTSSAPETATSAKTCGCRRTSLATIPAATSSTVNDVPSARSAAMRAWNTTCSSTSPSSSQKAC